MFEKYLSINVEYGRITVDEEGKSVVSDDHTESFEVTDPYASLSDMFDDLALEVRNSLEA